MTKNDPQQPAAPADGGVKPAGRTGEGSGSIVAELANEDRRVDHLVNRLGPPALDADPGAEARAEGQVLPRAPAHFRP